MLYQAEPLPDEFVSLRGEEGNTGTRRLRNVAIITFGAVSPVCELGFACVGKFGRGMKSNRGARKYRITGDGFRALPGLGMLWELGKIPLRLTFQ